MTINEPTIATIFGLRSTFVEVDLSQLSRNLNAIRAKVAPAKIMIVLKANAYGHGLTEVANYLDPQVDYIGVAVFDEGILQLPESHFDMVRPGILFYGVYPSPEAQRIVEVKPALAWKSRVVYFKVTLLGHPVSYGSTWQYDHNLRIATVLVGYGDGYFRSMSNKAQVVIHGKRCPQVRRVCMDQIMGNIEADSAFNGDEDNLIGEAKNGERVTVEELAEWADTIPYEILTNINTRVPRTYFT